MFTLKLFRRTNGLGSQLVTSITQVDHVQVMEIGTSGRMIELWAFAFEGPSTYESYFIGEKEDGMDSVNEYNNWGWGLLENANGVTSQHFRPASYG